MVCPERDDQKGRNLVKCGQNIEDSFPGAPHQCDWLSASDFETICLIGNASNKFLMSDAVCDIEWDAAKLVVLLHHFLNALSFVTHGLPPIHFLWRCSTGAFRCLC